MCFFRPFGAWALQRQEERIALKNWQKLWSTNARGGNGGDNKEVEEVATNYLRRGNHNNFVEKHIAAKHLAREKKKSWQEARAKIRVEMKRREAEEENLTRKPSNTSKGREEKKRTKEVKKSERQCLRDDEVRKEREESRRLRIEELKSAQVLEEFLHTIYHQK